jgi:hypothetical protein
MKKEIHWSFWVIGTIALIWNGLGVANYLVQMIVDSSDAYREVERALIEGRPAWATAAFAIAVFGGTLGSALLLLKKSVALHLFLASLTGVIVTMIHALGVDIEFGPGEVAGIILMPLAVAVFLVWYSKFAQTKHWTL